MLIDFYPRSPRGERPNSLRFSLKAFIFLSTLPARGATNKDEGTISLLEISIHAPREGSDPKPGAFVNRNCGISIHAPREGSDRKNHRVVQQQRHFYPRSPRGERQQERFLYTGQTNFYPRSPRGERPNGTIPTLRPSTFLSTLPARGATGETKHRWNTWNPFLSTLPARGATWRGALAPAIAGISIHAPREGSDRW